LAGVDASAKARIGAQARADHATLAGRVVPALATFTKIPEVTLFTEIGKAGLERAREAESSSDPEARREALDYLTDRLRILSSLMNEVPLDEGSFFEELVSGGVGGVAAELVIDVGSTFSGATGFDRKAIEAAAASGAGKDAARVDRGLERGEAIASWGIGAAVLAVALLAGYVAWRLEGNAP
jgi:hypothetical protein